MNDDARKKVKGKITEASENWQTYFDYNYLGHWDIPDSGEKIVTIKKVENWERAMVLGKEKNITVAYFAEDNKPMVLNKENSKRISRLFKSLKPIDWIGKKIILTSEYVSTGIYKGNALRVKEVLPNQKNEKKVLDIDSSNFEQIKNWLSEDQNNKIASVEAKYTLTDAAKAELMKIKQE